VVRESSPLVITDIPDCERSKGIIGIGQNYVNHVEEGDRETRGGRPGPFAPFGPYLHTPDEIDAVGVSDIRTELNGNRLRELNTEHLTFSIAGLPPFCSRAFTSGAGDVILTGTPDGVGYFRDSKCS